MTIDIAVNGVHTRLMIPALALASFALALAWLALALTVIHPNEGK
jgi:hypothetical protein